MPSVAIIRNGTIEPSPDYAHKMTALSSQDLIDLAALAVTHDIFDGIDRSGDWPTHEMATIDRLIAVVSGRYRSALRMHWFGTDSQLSLVPRAKLILEAMADDGVAQAWGNDDAGVITGIAGIIDNTGFFKVVAGDDSVNILRDDGTIARYGGGGAVITHPTLRFTDLAAAGQYVVGLVEDGTLVVESLEETAEAWTPTLNYSSSAPYVAVATGLEFYAALRSDKTMEIWGTLPSGVAFNSAWQGHITNICAGGKHLLMVLDEESGGMVVACGDNCFGQCDVPTALAAGTDRATWLAADLLRSYAVVAPSHSLTKWGAQLITTGTILRIFANPARCAIICDNGVVPATVVVQGHRGPSKIDGGAACFDSTRGLGVHFGGLLSDGTTKMRETWERGDTDWEPKFPATRPAARADHVIGFDTVVGRAVLWGDTDTVAVRDAWEWDGVNWTGPYAESGTRPGGSRGQSICFDPGRGSGTPGRTLIYGGQSAGGTYVGTCHDYDAAAHTFASHTLGGSPGSRSYHRMVYDSARDKLVLYAGRNSSGVALATVMEATAGGTGTTTFATVTPATTTPAARWGHSMVYDVANAVTVIYGGKGDGAGDYWNDAYKWNGTDWALITPAGGIHPGKRRGHSCYYDAVREVIVIHGGFGETTPGSGSFTILNDTWELDVATSTWTQIDTTDVPTGSIPSATANMRQISFALGKGFAAVVDRHSWSCGTIAHALVGLCQAHGIPAMMVGGNGTDCSGDVMCQIWSVVHQTWMLVFPHAGVYMKDSTGKPMGLTQVRAAHDAAQYQIASSTEVGEFGYRLAALLGSGITGYPSSICAQRLYPFVDAYWWSLMRRVLSPPATDIISTLYGWHLNDWNKDPPQSSTVGDLAFDDFTTVDLNCSADHSGLTSVAIDDADWNYRLNNIHAEVELLTEVPILVEITLTNNMGADTGGFDRYDVSLNGGATWAEISTVLSDQGGGVYRWSPAGSAVLLIRGENAAGVTSPEVEIQVAVPAGRTRRMLMGV